MCGASEPLELLGEVDRGGQKLKQFQMTAYTGGLLNVDGFYRPVVVDLSGMEVPRQRLPILRQHDPERIVAHSETVDPSQQRIKVAGVMSGVGDAAGEVMTTAANGFPWQASIGAQVHAKEFVDAGQTVKVNGRNFDGPVIVARKSTLREVSFVPLGADLGSSATVSANLGGLDVNFREWLIKKGFEPDKLTAEGRASLEAAYRAEQTPPPPPPVPVVPPIPPRVDGGVAAELARERAERRIDERLEAALRTRRITGDAFTEIRAQAFAKPEEWDDNRIELEIVRRERPTGPHISTPRDVAPADEVLECAVAMTGSLQNIDKVYTPQVCEAARKRWKAGLTIGELVVMAAQRNGCRAVSLRGNLKEVLQAAVRIDLKADGSPSTYSIPNILSNVANKFALQGFYSVDSTWGRLCARRSVGDFKQITSVRLTGNLQFRRLAPGGEIKHGDIGELAYFNQAHTFARMIGISREDWINDDSGALSGTSIEMGVGAGDAINDEFWRIFLNSGTFFTAGNNNVSSGPFSLANVGILDTVFRNQVKPNGRPLGLVPSILLVPTATRIAALNLVASTLVVSSTTVDKPIPASSVLQGAYNVESSPYLSNTLYTGNSATAYYLLASPSQLATIEGVFLNGVETPTVETADFDWDMLGTTMRGFIDFGFALQEFRAGARSTGV